LCDEVFLLYTFSEHLVQEDPMGLVIGKEILEVVKQKARLFGSAGKAREVRS
jgi:hypothetical protein